MADFSSRHRYLTLAAPGVNIASLSRVPETVGGAIARAGYRGFDPSALVWGSVEEVVDKFRALEPLGYTDIIVRHITDNQAKVLASLARLAEVRKALHAA